MASGKFDVRQRSRAQTRPRAQTDVTTRTPLAAFVWGGDCDRVTDIASHSRSLTISPPAAFQRLRM